MSKSESLKPHWFHILLTLADQQLHGTAIMEEVLDRTDGTVRLWPGMLYGSLSDLADKGWIEEVDPPQGAPTEGGKRRFYGITPHGRLALAREVERMELFLQVARKKRVGETPRGVG